MEAGNESQLTAGSTARGRTHRATPGLPDGAARWSVAAALAAGLALRLWMLHKFFEVNGDALIYGGLAKNLLLHGRYALTVAGGETYPTLIRLPGYPLFLAACFRIFGMENYASAAWVSIALDLIGCLLLASFTRQIAPPRIRDGAAQAALWLAVLCPFTAVYAAQPLTEAPTLFAISLALWAAARFCEGPRWWTALAFTFAVTFAALLRPDGALVAVALVPAIVVGLRRKEGIRTMGVAGAKAQRIPMALSARLRSCTDTKPVNRSSSAACLAPKGTTRRLRMALVCLLLALAPFAAWTWRNWSVFHVFEPLAPRLATDPGEDPHAGWERWVKSWCLDFVSTYDIYWNVPDGQLDLDKLPARAFDSPAQRAETAALVADYNAVQTLTPEIDARFAHLAAERVAAHPLRFYVFLPLGRLADMWLRPRVENLPIDLDWWVYAHHYAETRFGWFYAGLNAFYLLLGVAGLCLRPRFWGCMLAYFLLRSALLLTVEAPEARYTLECFPMLFALGGIGLWGLLRRNATPAAVTGGSGPHRLP
jgi:hypothetical protein